MQIKTEEEMKKFLLSVIDGDKWEYFDLVTYDIDKNDIRIKHWKSYKLGDEIHSDWEYRKEWYVVDVEDRKENERPLIYDSLKGFYLIKPKILKVCYSKEECEQWISENIEAFWLEKKYPTKNKDEETKKNKSS